MRRIITIIAALLSLGLFADEIFIDPPELTPAEDLSSIMCEQFYDLVQNKVRIEHQKDLGKAGGVMNKQVLYDASRVVVRTQRELKAEYAQYKALTKKTWEYAKAGCRKPLETIGDDGELN